jgi:D-sedoheptulose 7-phosphate isomerase
MTTFIDYTDELNTLLGKMLITCLNGSILSLETGMGDIQQQLRMIKTKRKKVMVIGNGGSAAIASHLHNDLSKAAGIRATVFTEPPLLTALSNDISYNAAYRELVQLWADEGDMLIAISSSGRSQNILDAVAAARSVGCGSIITLSGFHPENPLRILGDLNCYIASNEYGYVELAHSVIAHHISDQIKNN